jgi:hypothetical protein
MGRWIARHAPADAPLGVYRLDDWRGSLRFHSCRHLVVVAKRGGDWEFFDRYPESFTLMLARDYGRFDRKAFAARAGVAVVRSSDGQGAIRKQIWDRIVVTTPPDVEADLRIDESAIGQDLVDHKRRAITNDGHYVRRRDHSTPALRITNSALP